MANYIIKSGECISDAVENIFGDITNWSATLDENLFTSWTPTLYAGQILNIPTEGTNNPANIQALSEYPANNYSVPDINEQIAEIFEQMEGGMSAFVPNFQPIVADTNTYFEALSGMQISDVVVNSTGAIENWDSILTAGNYDTWTPKLIAGQKIAIPASVTMNLNNFRALSIYPANNYSVPDVDSQINSIFERMSNPNVWILQTGRWNGAGIWTIDGEWLTV
jgi:hypothetical protein